jgi:hypothetical protein
MLLRKLVVVGLVGFVSFAANIATAEDAVGPSASFVGASGVDFADPSQAFPDRFQINTGQDLGARFAAFAPAEPSDRVTSDSRRYQVELVASSAAGYDLAFAQRAGLGFNQQGDVEREMRGSELRLGRGLRSMPRDRPSAQPTWYVFAASEDEALIWRPGFQRNAFGGAGPSFALQDRVEIGDMSAGITYERYGVQASLAYVQREISVRSGARTYSQDSDFAGFTLTMRH